MYIHHAYELLEPTQELTLYKQKLASVCKINLRRANKFNLLAVYGALSCLQNKPFSSNIGIYLATEYGPVESMVSVLEQVSKKDGIIMPFDFLGINTNASFYIAQALKAEGKHMMLTAHNQSFEKALQLAYFDLIHKEVDDVLVGYVDTSLSFIEEKHHPFVTQNTHDQSYWLYANREPHNALARIESIEAFANNEVMHRSYPDTILNSGTIFQCLAHESKNLLHVKHDEKGKCMVIKMQKL
ncbi:hypothetical protein [Sulfurospirillum barnesii]|uniref:Beta-ketoacyl synthase N-terminal domain-containing protein n=1 Tax=Sulfurospirillum barnesii (strain ATCC 700032 / DSM 10660 / SES-3) TaxID=760154 RepID=I3Y003_SULBS|nr:hypothetical protein [Sulfurospirillum barnesii]AFL69527.1 hypothetical protein Sulba_2252 [Sulfurospirillum barnesii SES-3]